MQKYALLFILLLTFSVNALAETLYFRAYSNAGIKDTVFAQRKKITIPNSVSISPSSATPYTVKIRFIGEYDTITAIYGASAGSTAPLITTGVTNPIYASHIDLQVTAATPIQVTAMLVINTATIKSCFFSNYCSSGICNGEFSSAISCGEKTLNKVERANIWTSEGFAHYFATNCTYALPISNNQFGSQTDNYAYVGVSAY